LPGYRFHIVIGKASNAFSKQLSGCWLTGVLLTRNEPAFFYALFARKNGALAGGASKRENG
jgi:hypothetical protein